MDNECANVACGACNKNFFNLYNLRRHVKQFHPTETQLAPPLQLKNKNNYKYSCDECHKYFNDVYKFNHHNKKEHGLQQMNVHCIDKKKCPLCQYSASTKNEIMKHFEIVHKLKTELKYMEFSSLEEFNKWKSAFEEETVAKFIIEKNKKSKHYQTIKYMCHRSGFYKPKGKGERHIKTQGSQKINGFCPAGAKIVVDNEGKCQCEIVMTHVGHKNEIQHIQLTQQERRSLAMKLAAKIPFECILDEIRDTIEGTDLKRIHLLNKKDLYNIEKCFNLSSTVVRHSNDAVSVDSWINQVKEECVLFYKQQDTTVTEHPELRSEDFVLILMNSAQTEMLQTYGSDCVCLDGTHGLNSYNFEMNTLLVIDDMRQGFPCAFLVSNRSDELVFKIFLSYIKQRAGHVEPNVFMSDMADAYYNAWINVMGTPKLRLYCTWHVDRAWRKNLSKINNKEKQAFVYKSLRTILQETDPRAFNKMIDNFYRDLQSNNDTKLFAIYFRDNYMNIATRWAYCHRLQSGLNTNMHIERMHRTIKYIYLGGKKVKRLDKSLHAIMRFVRDKLFDRLISMNKGKITTKVRYLRKRHQESLKLDITLVVENGEGWDIPSSSKNNFNMYHIEKTKDACDCQLICSDCEVCLHKYSCSCIDSSVRWNMCKHIHILCKYIREKAENKNSLPSVLDEKENILLDIDTLSSDKGAHCENILTELSRNNIFRGKTVEDDKREVLDLLYKLTEKVHNTNSPSKLKVFKKMLAPISPTINALENDRSSLKFVTQSSPSEPPNKRIKVQRRLFSTHKPRSNKKKDGIRKPSSAEIQELATSLLLQEQKQEQEDNPVTVFSN